MKRIIRTRPANGNAISFAEAKAAREFRQLRLDQFGRGRLAEERAAEFLGISHRTLQNYESAATRVPHAAVLMLRERLRGVAA